MLALNPWILVAAGLALAGAVGGAYVKGRSDGRAVEIAERTTLEEVARTAREASQQAAAEQIAKIEIVNKTVYARATREVVEKPVYRDCVHSGDGLRAINEALTGRPEPAGDISVPGTDAASR